MARPLSLAYITMSGKPADVFAQAAAAAGFDSIGEWRGLVARLTNRS